MPTGQRGPRDPNRCSEAGRVLRFTVTTTLLALGAQACHRTTGHVYVNEGPSPTPPEGQGGADAGTPPSGGDDGATTPEGDDGSDVPTAKGPVITPIGDPPPPGEDPKKPVVMVNPGPTTPPKPQPPAKPTVIVNPGPTTPPGTPRP